jgi:ribosomal protein S2
MFEFASGSNRKFKKVSRWEGGYFSILSPAEPFWRHLPTLERLYQDLEKSTITQEEFITLVDEILEAKKQIALYKKHFDSLSAKEKIEIKEEIEKLEKKIEEDIEKIDYLTFKLYKLDADEITLIEEKL